MILSYSRPSESVKGSQVLTQAFFFNWENWLVTRVHVPIFNRSTIHFNVIVVGKNALTHPGPLPKGEGEPFPASLEIP